MKPRGETEVQGGERASIRCSWVHLCPLSKLDLAAGGETEIAACLGQGKAREEVWVVGIAR